MASRERLKQEPDNQIEAKAKGGLSPWRIAFLPCPDPLHVLIISRLSHVNNFQFHRHSCDTLLSAMDETYAEKLAQYERLVATQPEVKRKGATNPYSSMNGNMFSRLDPSGTLSLRLPSGPREEFLAKYGTKLYESYGIVQKEYVTVPDALLANTEELTPYFAMSVAYVGSLKAKPTTKGKVRA